MRMFLLFVFTLSMFPGISAAQNTPVALEGARLITITQGIIDNGTIVLHSGKIIAVGNSGDVRVPANARRVDATDKIIMPGLVDTHSHVGISGYPAVSANSDGNEGSGPVQSGLRAIDAINPADPRIVFARAGGITTVNIMPGSGVVVGGTTAYVKTRGKTIEEMLINPDGISGGMKMANGENPKNYGRGDGQTMTRMAIAALQRKLFISAIEYKKKLDNYAALSAAEQQEQPAPDRDLELEPVVEILEKRRIVHHHTHRADDIMTILRLKEEFDFEVILHHVTEGYLVADEIAAADVPASIITLDSPGSKYEAVNYSLRMGAIMEQAGVQLSFHTDDAVTDSRLFLRSVALQVREGMTENTALEALTINGAKMLQLDDRLGSLDSGKDADIIVLSGHPFSVNTHVMQTWIEGELVFDFNRPEDRRYATGGYPLGNNYPVFEK
jgi:imidazolonepropionase-like amidohydrolase